MNWPTQEAVLLNRIEALNDDVQRYKKALEQAVDFAEIEYVARPDSVNGPCIRYCMDCMCVSAYPDSRPELAAYLRDEVRP